MKSREEPVRATDEALGGSDFSAYLEQPKKPKSKKYLSKRQRREESDEENEDPAEENSNNKAEEASIPLIQQLGLLFRSFKKLYFSNYSSFPLVSGVEIPGAIEDTNLGKKGISLCVVDKEREDTFRAQVKTSFWLPTKNMSFPIGFTLKPSGEFEVKVKQPPAFFIELILIICAIASAT